MPKEKIQNLLTELHESFGSAEPSQQQQALLAEVQRHIHDMGTPDVPDQTFSDTLELLVEDMKEDHPQGAAIVSQIMKVLVDIGV